MIAVFAKYLTNNDDEKHTGTLRRAFQQFLWGILRTAVSSSQLLEIELLAINVPVSKYRH